MRAKDYLRQVRTLTWKAAKLERMYTQAIRERTFYKPINLNGMPGGGSADAMAESDRLVDLRLEMERAIRRRDEHIQKCRLQINGLKEPYATILRLRYLDGKNLTWIANAIGYSYGETARKHLTALDIFEAKYLL